MSKLLRTVATKKSELAYFLKKKSTPEDASFSTLTIDVRSARGLAAQDTNGLADVYCVLTVANSQVVKTSVVKRTLNPVWNESFTVKVSRATLFLVIDVLDSTGITRDDVMGRVMIPLRSSLPSDARWYRLNRLKKSADVSGEIMVKISRNPSLNYDPDQEMRALCEPFPNFHLSIMAGAYSAKRVARLSVAASPQHQHQQHQQQYQPGKGFAFDTPTPMYAPTETATASGVVSPRARSGGVPPPRLPSAQTVQLPGDAEHVEIRMDDIVMSIHGVRTLGTLWLTNFRLVFLADTLQDEVVYSRMRAFTDNTSMVSPSKRSSRNPLQVPSRPNTPSFSHASSANGGDYSGVSDESLKILGWNSTPNLLTYIPLGSIQSISSFDSRKLQRRSLKRLSVYTNDVRQVKFFFPDKSEVADRFYERIEFRTTNSDCPATYDFFESHKNISSRFKEWSLKWNHEMDRQHVDYDKWQSTPLNIDHELCDTYPPQVFLPSSLIHSTRVIREAARFRSRGRLPVLSWYSEAHQNSLVRCAQPNTGFAKKSSIEDEHLLRTIRESSPGSPNKLYIVDARSQLAADGNKFKGKGTEVMNRYTMCEKMFMDIANIHAMRESVDKLAAVCRSARQIPDTRWNGSVEATQWLDHGRMVMKAGVTVVRLMTVEKASVVVHCSDGWDRTTQIVCLAQLMLDPYFRTFDGFRVLVEKDFIAFGHQFEKRLGHPRHPKERSPVFLQFLDCVSQMLVQFPSSFEFNDRYLVFLADHCQSGWFGTFLFNSDRLRVADERQHVPLWSHVDAERDDMYRNERFDSNSSPVIVPVVNARMSRLWSEYFMRYEESLIAKPPHVESYLEDTLVKQAVTTTQEYLDNVPASSSILAAAAGLTEDSVSVVTVTGGGGSSGSGSHSGSGGGGKNSSEMSPIREGVRVSWSEHPSRARYSYRSKSVDNSAEVSDAESDVLDAHGSPGRCDVVDLEAFLKPVGRPRGRTRSRASMSGGSRDDSIAASTDGEYSEGEQEGVPSSFSTTRRFFGGASASANASGYSTPIEGATSSFSASAHNGDDDEDRKTLCVGCMRTFSLFRRKKLCQRCDQFFCNQCVKPRFARAPTAPHMMSRVVPGAQLCDKCFMIEESSVGTMVVEPATGAPGLVPGFTTTADASEPSSAEAKRRLRSRASRATAAGSGSGGGSRRSRSPLSPASRARQALLPGTRPSSAINVDELESAPSSRAPSLRRPPSSPLPRTSDSRSAFSALSRNQKQSFVDALMSDPLPLSLSTELLLKAEAQHGGSRSEGQTTRSPFGFNTQPPPTSDASPSSPSNGLTSRAKLAGGRVHHGGRNTVAYSANALRSWPPGSRAAALTSPAGSKLPSGVTSLLARGRSKETAQRLPTVKETPLQQPFPSGSFHSRRRASSASQLPAFNSLSTSHESRAKNPSSSRKSRQSDPHLSPAYVATPSSLSPAFHSREPSSSHKNPSPSLPSSSRQSSAPSMSLQTSSVSAPGHSNYPDIPPPPTSTASPPSISDLGDSLKFLSSIPSSADVHESPSAPLGAKTLPVHSSQQGSIPTSEISNTDHPIPVRISRTIEGPHKALPEPPLPTTPAPLSPPPLVAAALNPTTPAPSSPPPLVTAETNPTTPAPSSPPPLAAAAANGGVASPKTKQRPRTLIRLRRSKHICSPPLATPTPHELAAGTGALMSDQMSRSIVPRSRRDARILQRQRSSSLDITARPSVSDSDLSADPKPVFEAVKPRWSSRASKISLVSDWLSNPIGRGGGGGGGGTLRARSPQKQRATMGTMSTSSDIRSI